MASRRLVRSSSIVSACVAQPGIEGTSAQNPPSSALWTMARIFIEIMVEAAGVEPASEKVYREKTTCVSDSVFFDRSIRTGKREAA